MVSVLFYMTNFFLLLKVQYNPETTKKFHSQVKSGHGKSKLKWSSSPRYATLTSVRNWFLNFYFLCMHNIWGYFTVRWLQSPIRLPLLKHDNAELDRSSVESFYCEPSFDCLDISTWYRTIIFRYIRADALYGRLSHAEQPKRGGLCLYGPKGKAVLSPFWELSRAFGSILPESSAFKTSNSWLSSSGVSQISDSSRWDLLSDYQTDN